MYREEADGSAVVHGIAVAPFVPVQHMQIDITAVNMLGTYCFRFARERGWLQTSEELAQATPYAESNDARPLIEHEGHAYRTADNTFFFAGVEEALANPHPHFHYPPTPSTLFACAHFYLVHVGSSSYGVFSRLYTYLDGQENTMQHLLGTFKVTTVWVSKVKRTPAPLTPSKHALFRAILDKAKTRPEALRGDAVRVQRLDAQALLARSGWFADAAAVSAKQLRTTREECPSTFSVTLPGDNAPLHLLVRRSFTLRETDIDFNQHVNQLVSKVFVINAFRGALADATCAYSRLLRPGELALRSDLLLRKFRIDYVREVPMRYAGVEVHLFPLDLDRVKAQFQAACKLSRHAVTDDGACRASPTPVDDTVVEMMEIGFFMVGVPAKEEAETTSPPSPSEKFIATIGVMTATACFLPLSVPPAAPSV